MNKDKGFGVLAIVLPVCGLVFYFATYFFIDWVSTSMIKKYDEKPAWSSAPVPHTNKAVNHIESSSACGGEQIYKSYRVDKPASEVESYYQQEMEKSCLSQQGWQVTFTTRLCYGWDEIRTQDCRYAACVLKNEAPSLYENFSVMIFEISPTETYVLQNQGMHYWSTTPSNVQCGE